MKLSNCEMYVLFLENVRVYTYTYMNKRILSQSYRIAGIRQKKNCIFGINKEIFFDHFISQLYNVAQKIFAPGKLYIIW